MSTISSKVDSIDRLWFEPLTAKVVIAQKVTMVDNTLVVLGKDGKIYTNGVLSSVCYSSHGDDGRIGRVLDGCIKLKVLSANAVRQHKESVAKYKAERDRKWDFNRLKELTERLGIELTASQLETIGATS